MVIATRYPQLQQTDTYKKLQTIFTNHLRFAALYAKKGDTQKASEIVGEFVRVEEKKTAIRLLLVSPNEFLEFIRCVSCGDVAKAYTIVLNDPRFKELDLYHELISQIERMLDRVEAAINANEFDTSVLLNELSEYPRTKKLMHKYRHLQQLHATFDEEAFERCYVLLDEHPFLIETDLGKRLEQHWQDVVQRCKTLSARGMFEDVVQTLDFFIRSEVKQGQVGRILRKTARRSIERFIDNGEYEKAEKNIYRYLELFGKDVLVIDVMQRFEKLSEISLALMPEFKKVEERWVSML